MDDWYVWTEVEGLAWIRPTFDDHALTMALEDCATTLSPRGEPAGLSTYFLDHTLACLRTGAGEVAHGNLWVLTLVGRVVEVRMDVDDSTSDPLTTIVASRLVTGLELLRAEVVEQRRRGHRLKDTVWSQRNPH